MKTIRVNTQKPYDVLVGSGLLAHCGELINGYDTVVVITDDHVAPLYLQTVKTSFNNTRVLHYVVKNGEVSKSMETLSEIYEFLAQNAVTRSDLLVALGGGVIGDLTGFAAASFLRGVDFIGIPTTLLAQVDSSVGGKTGINISAGKNLVGAFYQPKLVVCDIDTLETLPPKQFSCGMAEVIKYAAISSEKMASRLLNQNIKDILSDIIYECITIKKDIVSEDEFENGKRMLLNFGHTLGHAIEKELGYGTVTHGEAVAIGMSIITYIYEGNSFTKKGTHQELTQLLEKYNLPTHCKLTLNSLIEQTLRDKKRKGGSINIIALKQMGQAEILKISVQKWKELGNE